MALQFNSSLASTMTRVEPGVWAAYLLHHCMCIVFPLASGTHFLPVK